MYTTNIFALLSIISVAFGQTSPPLALAVLPPATLDLLPEMGTSMPMVPSVSATTVPTVSESMIEAMVSSMATTMPSVTMPMDPTVTAMTSMSSMTTSMLVGTGMLSMNGASGGGNMSMTLPTLKGSSTASGSAKPSGSGGPSVATNGGTELGSSIKTVIVVLAGFAGLFVLA